MLVKIFNPPRKKISRHAPVYGVMIHYKCIYLYFALEYVQYSNETVMK